ncbi:MAG: hypothetical protein POELPBGB_00885 [Bacteroidia bacterium]|nr:hypothetical protein [Bacteroidia bacterium]
MSEILLNAWQQTSWIEIIAVIFSIAYTILAAYESNWCWPAAIISVSIYTSICFSAKLYSETGLQVFYLIMAFYGWFEWTRNGQQKPELKISKIDNQIHLLLVVAGITGTALLYYIMKKYTDAALPLADSVVTAFSLVTTYMMVKKYIENWLWWIVIDGLAVYIYISRGYTLTAVLYFIYVIIVVVAYFKWRKLLLK